MKMVARFFDLCTPTTTGAAPFGADSGGGDGGWHIERRVRQRGGWFHRQSSARISEDHEARRKKGPSLLAHGLDSPAALVAFAAASR
jgi:hypothetical protein